MNPSLIYSWELIKSYAAPDWAQFCVCMKQNTARIGLNSNFSLRFPLSRRGGGVVGEGGGVVGEGEEECLVGHNLV